MSNVSLNVFKTFDHSSPNKNVLRKVRHFEALIDGGGEGPREGSEDHPSKPRFLIIEP